jgi:GMP synthase-like glutamine amidotransferase
MRGVGVICYVDMEHPKLLTDPTWDDFHGASLADVKQRLERISGSDCVIRRYDAISPEWLAAAEIGALVISGNVTDWDDYDEVSLEGITRAIHQAALPILGLCGGCQLMALVHDAPMGPLRRLRKGEQDPYDAFAPGYFKEWGFVPVRLLRPDPLFSGLEESPMFLEAHYWEIKEVPAGFELLASTDACRVQVIRRRGTLVYGTQFHPEAYVEGPEDSRSALVKTVYPEGYAKRQIAGRVLLRNFLQLAGIL